jgi:D-3-phosphoglycerate dehydrogenase
MIGEAQLKKMKKTAYVVNVARGGLIDEQALAAALEAGEIAGAGIDVFTQEPPANDDITRQPNAVVTPHLGASTEEAQEKAGISVAKSVKLALEGDLVPDAVNVAGGAIDPFVRPGISLVEKLGQVFSGVARGPLTSLEIDVRGELADYDVSVYKLAALKGILGSVVSEKVSYVNAPVIAEQRGIETRLNVEKDSPEFRNLTTLTGTLADGTVLSIAGTLAGTRMVPKIVGINGHELDAPLAEHHLVIVYKDRPGVVAIYADKFGAGDINIDGLQVARGAGDEALSLITVDKRVPDDVVASIGEAIDARIIRQIEIVED